MESTNREKLRWILRLRFHMIFGILFLTWIGLEYNYLQPEKYVLFVGALFLFLASTLSSYFVWKKKIPIAQGYIFAQLLSDLFVFTMILSANGGHHNPFVAMFFLHAMMGGMLLDRNSGRIFLGILIVTIAYIQYLSVTYLSFQFHLPAIFGAQYIITFGSWFLARSLNQHLMKTQKQLNQMRLASERMDRLRSVGALISGLSHEIASPLNTIKIQMDRVIRKDIRPSETDDYLLVQESIEKCSGALVKMNQVNIDSRTLDPETFDLNDLISEILEVWKADHPGVKTQIRIVDGLKLKIPVLSFTQMMLNLFDNAFESSSEAPEVSIIAENMDKDLVLQVKDNGAGFQEDILARFGQPFNTSKPTGTGLGLYSSLLFMNSLGGTIQLDNNQLKGACVRLVFPETVSAT